MIPRAVLDTNVFVAAGFNPSSHAARLVDAVAIGELTLVWNATTRDEVLYVLGRIPPLTHLDAAVLFRPEAAFHGIINPDAYQRIPDAADRVFAALADAADAPLVTNDAHLLSHQADLRVPVLTPRTFWDTYMVVTATRGAIAPAAPKRRLLDRRVVLMDSIAYLDADDAGAIVICGSHGGVSLARYALSQPLAAVFFNDAGRGKEQAGVAGLTLLDAAGVPAGAVAHTSARIGDAEDAWANGILSALNRTAAAIGLKPGMSLQEAVALLDSARK